MTDKNSKGAQIRSKRKKIKIEYRKFYDDVSKILFTHDPIGINFETNDDEYEPEVDTILPRLKMCNSAEDVLTVVHQEFQKWFDEDIAGEKSRYKEIAEEIWELWQRRK